MDMSWGSVEMKRVELAEMVKPYGSVLVLKQDVDEWYCIAVENLDVTRDVLPHLGRWSKGDSQDEALDKELERKRHEHHGRVLYANNLLDRKVMTLSTKSSGLGLVVGGRAG